MPRLLVAVRLLLKGAGRAADVAVKGKLRL
jgi:hypothetical protein